MQPTLFRLPLSSLGRLILIVGLLASVAAAKPVKFDIPAQSAANALLVFSKQCGIDVLYSFADLQAVRSQAVSGELEPDAALAVLLRDTGYAATRDPAGKFVVTAARRPESTPTVPVAARDAVAKRENGTIVGRVLNIDNGRYLNNARVSIQGTALFTFTDQTGTYRLTNVPPGPVVVAAFYTGLESQEANVSAVGGSSVDCDFQLQWPDKVFRLDKVTVRETRDAEAIAINQQRFAPNLELVAAPGRNEFIAEANIGEFMKTLPGVSAEYWGSDEITNISIRGFDDHVIGVTIDGAPFATASAFGSYRGFDLANVSANNVSRVEVTLVPTPATPADSLGGSVNLVTRSAFERSTPELDYRMFFSANQYAMKFGRSPDPSDRKIYKILPGFTFNYVLPVNRNFGLVLSANRSDERNEDTETDKEFVTSRPGTTASVSHPFVRSAQFIYSPTTIVRNGASLRADWRATPNTVLSFSLQGVDYSNQWASMTWYPDTGASAFSRTSSGTNLSFGPDFTNGATGQGDIRMTGGFAKIKNSSLGQNLTWRFDDGAWRVEAAAAHSLAKQRFLGPSEGYFNGQRLFANPADGSIAAHLPSVIPLRVNLLGITASGPTTVQVFDSNNQPVDPSKIDPYKLDLVFNSPSATEATTDGVEASVRRQFAGSSFPFTLQIGGSRYARTNDTRARRDNYNFTGGAQGSLAPYLSVMANQRLGPMSPPVPNGIPWTSVRKLYAAWQQAPGLFVQTPDQQITSETARVGTSEWIRETVTAGYVQGEARFLHNRLNLVTGLRWEKTSDVGLGPLVDLDAVYLHDAQGAVVRDARGVPIRRPEAGAAGSLEEVRLTHIERGHRAAHAYDGYYPSINATYNVSDKIQVRFGYAQTYGRPDFFSIIPRASNAPEDQFQGVFVGSDTSRNSRGTLYVSNLALKPWTAQSYDVSLEYYSDDGGLATVGAFQKNVRNFFDDATRPVTAEELAGLGLDSSYLNWQVATQTNAGSARISGLSLNVKQSLRALGRFGRYFSVFGNATQLHLQGDREADFSSFIQSSANWGFDFDVKGFELVARWNYRGRQKTGSDFSLGPDVFDYSAPTTMLDVTATYRFRQRVEFFLHARNLFNEQRIFLTYGSQTPSYARQWITQNYGAQFTAGIKGTF